MKSKLLKKWDMVLADDRISPEEMVNYVQNLIDVESNLDRAYKLSRNNSAINTVRGEYYLITGNPVLGLKAFQSALDASAKDSPEYAQIKRYVEQVTAILVAQANINYHNPHIQKVFDNMSKLDADVYLFFEMNQNF